MARSKNKRTISGVMSVAVISAFVAFGRMAESGGAHLPGQWKGAWLTTLVSFAFTLLILPFFAALSDILLARDNGGSTTARAVRLVYSLAAGVSAVYVGVWAVGKCGGFVAKVMDINADKTLVAAILLLGAAYTAASGAEAVRKFSRVALALAVISAVGLFFLSLSSGGSAGESFRTMMSEDALAEASDAEGIKLAFLSIFAPAAVGIVWMAETGEKGGNAGKAISDTIKGLALGGGVIGLCFLTVIFSEGMAYASTQSYPYVSAVGSMTAGKLFMRPEGLVYFAYLAAAFTVLSVCLSLVSRLLDGGRMKKTPYAVAVVLLTVYFFQ